MESNIESKEITYTPKRLTNLKGVRYHSGSINSKGWQNLIVDSKIEFETEKGQVVLKVPLKITVSVKSGKLHLSNSAVTGTLDWTKAKSNPPEAKSHLVKYKTQIKDMIKDHLNPVKDNLQKVFPNLEHAAKGLGKKASIEIPFFVPEFLQPIYKGAVRSASRKGILYNSSKEIDHSAIKTEYLDLLRSYQDLIP
jgi:hypothetical protein